MTNAASKAIRAHAGAGCSRADAAPCHLGDHIRQNVIGAVAPKAVDYSASSSMGWTPTTFQFFLNELAKAVSKRQGVRPLIGLDNASWHKAGRLHSHHFEPKFLPGYWPDFNLIERLWLRLKADWFWDFIARRPGNIGFWLTTSRRQDARAPEQPRLARTLAPPKKQNVLLLDFRSDSRLRSTSLPRAGFRGARIRSTHPSLVAFSTPSPARVH
ncbi:MAG: transposase [Verrucomicrobia bacterium]|nr:transposase [Verrucomicrobiota bacterium]